MGVYNKEAVSNMSQCSRISTWFTKAVDLLEFQDCLSEDDIKIISQVLKEVGSEK